MSPPPRRCSAANPSLARVEWNQRQSGVERARAQGEPRPDADTLLVTQILGGPVFYHFIALLFLYDQPELDLEQLVDLSWKGLLPSQPDR